MKYFVLTLVVFSAVVSNSHAQLEGFWVAVDHVDGLEKSIIEIYEQSGKYFGRVNKLLLNATVTHCTGCEGALKDQEITGMVIIKNLKITSRGGKGGRILDPTSGKWYSCYFELDGQDKVKMRGYLGMPAFGKSQFWYRKKD